MWPPSRWSTATCANCCWTRPCDSPADIERLWDKLYTASIPYGRGGIAIMALSGIDLALWDLLGRAERQPVYALLGGSSAPRIRAYASGDDPEWFAETGFTAHKVPFGRRGRMPATFERAAAAAEASRRHLGADALLMFDCYMAWDADTRRARWRARWRLTTSTGSRTR